MKYCKTHYYTRQAHVTHSMNVHVNTRVKGNPLKAMRDGSIIQL